MGNGKTNSTFVMVWVVLMVVVLQDVKAALKTTFLEDLCSYRTTATMDLRFLPTGILMSLPQTESVHSFECTLTLLPPRESSVVLSIYRFDISPDDLLTIEDSDRFKISLTGYGNYKDEKKAFISDGKMIITYRRNTTENTHTRQGFQFTITAAAKKSGRCYDNEFQCTNNLCIQKDYVCDGHNHCGDGSDLKKCVLKDDTTSNSNLDPKPYRPYPNTNVIWISIIGAAGVVVFIIVIVFVVVVVRRSKTKKPNPPENNDQGSGGNLPLQSVSSTVPHPPASTTEAVPSAPPAPDHEAYSFYHRVRRSLRGRKSPKTEEVLKETVTSEVYQVPSMYPNLEHNETAEGGIENPEFKIDE